MVFRVALPKLDRQLRVAAGARLSEAIREAGLPLASSCGQTGLCARCGVKILEGAESLPPASAAETRAMERNRIDPALRLACHVRVEGDLRITAPYW